MQQRCDGQKCPSGGHQTVAWSQHRPEVQRAAHITQWIIRKATPRKGINRGEHCYALPYLGRDAPIMTVDPDIYQAARLLIVRYGAAAGTWAASFRQGTTPRLPLFGTRSAARSRSYNASLQERHRSA